MNIVRFEDTPTGASIVKRQKDALAEMMAARDALFAKTSENVMRARAANQPRHLMEQLRAETEQVKQRKTNADKELAEAQAALTAAQSEYGARIEPELRKGRDAAVIVLSKHLAAALAANAKVSEAEGIMESHNLAFCALAYTGLSGATDSGLSTQYSRWASRCRGQKVGIAEERDYVAGAVNAEYRDEHDRNMLTAREVTVMNQPLIEDAKRVIETGKALFGR